jgi:predicted regulator of Ras-like GTPase activity (Roadblock/LC7/MglB family)
MSFEQILQRVVDECGGGLGIALMGLDGITIQRAQPSVASSQADPFQGDVTTAGVEFGLLLADMEKVADRLGAGRARETMIGLDRATLIFQRVDEELMLVLAISPDGNVGKARYLMRRSLRALRDEL